MKLDKNHEIQVIIVERRGNVPGDVYNDFQVFRNEHPDAGYFFGFCVVNTETGFIPDGCNDWNDSVEEAYEDWLYNIKVNYPDL